MKLGWLSDIHLNFLDARALDRFLDTLAATPVDAWLISGDIAESVSVVGHLDRLATTLARPVWFVLGNHDYYGSSLAEVAAAVREAVAANERLIWLTEARPRRLAPGVAVVGDDGWGDARLGNPLTTPVLLNDFDLIDDLRGLGRRRLVETLRDLGDAAAARLTPSLDAAAREAREVVVVTHVPPFREAAWHEGRHSDDDWLPWFACQATGEALLVAAAAHPQVRFSVLCGHTHGAGACRPAPNVRVLTAGATYGAPAVQRVLTIRGDDGR